MMLRSARCNNKYNPYLDLINEFIKHEGRTLAFGVILKAVILDGRRT